MNFLKTVLKNLKHTFLFWKPSNLKKMFLQHGIAFLSAIIIWEIIEDIIFPMLMMFLGDTLNPMFYTIAPVTWFLCLHPIGVPVIWGLISYFHISKK
jgi:hypothetical protein